MPTKLLDALATVVLVVAVGIVALAIFAFLVIALNWLIIPVLLIVGSLAWLARRGKLNV